MNPLAFERNLPARLPTADTAASQSLDNQALARQAWLRAMEQSQVSGWFQPFAHPETLPATEKLQPKPPRVAHATAQLASFCSSAMRQHAEAAQPLATSTSPGISQVAQSAAVPGTAAGHVAHMARQAAPASQAPQSGVATSVAQPSSAAVQAQALIAEAAALPASGLASALQNMVGNLGLQAAAVPSANDPAPRLQPQPMPLPAQWISTQTRLVMSPISAITVAVESSTEHALPTDQASSKTAQFAAPRETATRTHAVWDQDNLSLWLGMDGTASQIGLQASMLIKTLRQSLSMQGQRLQRVVCNGQLIFDAATAGSAPDTFYSFSDVIDKHTPRAQVVAPVSSFSKESS
ncbi:hypothetical protein [Comamonas sediminis]|uniref:Flagellar hook-length control protein FliK n=1 Tax=Comamonas sediminis TaxID=1783360 RepID=A0ABV4B1Y4_9BURK